MLAFEIVSVMEITVRQRLARPKKTTDVIRSNLQVISGGYQEKVANI